MIKFPFFKKSKKEKETAGDVDVLVKYNSVALLKGKKEVYIPPDIILDIKCRNPETEKEIDLSGRLCTALKKEVKETILSPYLKTTKLELTIDTSTPFNSSKQCIDIYNNRVVVNNVSYTDISINGIRINFYKNDGDRLNFDKADQYDIFFKNKASGKLLEKATLYKGGMISVLTGDTDDEKLTRGKILDIYPYCLYSDDITSDSNKKPLAIKLDCSDTFNSDITNISLNSLKSVTLEPSNANDDRIILCNNSYENASLYSLQEILIFGTTSN